MLAVREKVRVNEGQFAIHEVAAVAIVGCAVAFHFDDDVLRVGLGFAGDGERSDSGDGVLLGECDSHSISSACRKAILLSASKLVLPQIQGHSVQRSHSSSRRSTATRLRASMVRVAEWSASLHALASASTESAPMK